MCNCSVCSKPWSNIPYVQSYGGGVRLLHMFNYFANSSKYYVTNWHCSCSFCSSNGSHFCICNFNLQSLNENQWKNQFGILRHFHGLFHPFNRIICTANLHAYLNLGKLLQFYHIYHQTMITWRLFTYHHSSSISAIKHKTALESTDMTQVRKHSTI